MALSSMAWFSYRVSSIQWKGRWKHKQSDSQEFRDGKSAHLETLGGDEINLVKSSIHLSVCLPILLPIYLSIHLPICPSIHPSTQSPTHPPIHPASNPSIHPSTQPHIHPTTHPASNPSVSHAASVFTVFWVVTPCMCLILFGLWWKCSFRLLSCGLCYADRGALEFGVRALFPNVLATSFDSFFIADKIISSILWCFHYCYDPSFITS